MQTAHAVGKSFRKHGHHATRQIRAVSAGGGLLIKLGSLRDKVADVGDVHHQFKGAVGGIETHGASVVVIARVWWINGPRQSFCKVQSLSSIPRTGTFALERNGGKRRFRRNFFTETFAQLICVHHRGGFNSGLTSNAKHFNNRAFGIHAFGWKAHKIKRDLVAGLGIFCMRIAHHDGLAAKRFTIGLHNPSLAFLHQSSSEARATTLDHFNHAARHSRIAGATANRRSPSALLAADRATNAIAAHGVAKISRGQK